MSGSTPTPAVGRVGAGVEIELDRTRAWGWCAMLGSNSGRAIAKGRHRRGTPVRLVELPSANSKAFINLPLIPSQHHWDLPHELQAHGAYATFEPGQLTAIPLAYGIFVQSSTSAWRRISIRDAQSGVPRGIRLDVGYLRFFDSNWGGMGTSQSERPIEPLGVAWGNENSHIRAANWLGSFRPCLVACQNGCHQSMARSSRDIHSARLSWQTRAL